MDIVITLPANIPWKEYRKELEAVADGTQAMYFRVPTLPTKARVGDRCYILYRRLIVGWMEIVYIGGVEGYACTTTDTRWPAGHYVGRSGKFHQLANPIVASRGLSRGRGFQGFHYADPEWRNAPER